MTHTGEWALVMVLIDLAMVDLGQDFAVAVVLVVRLAIGRITFQNSSQHVH